MDAFKAWAEFFALSQRHVRNCAEPLVRPTKKLPQPSFRLGLAHAHRRRGVYVHFRTAPRHQGRQKCWVTVLSLRESGVVSRLVVSNLFICVCACGLIRSRMKVCFLTHWFSININNLLGRNKVSLKDSKLLCAVCQLCLWSLQVLSRFSSAFCLDPVNFQWVLSSFHTNSN